jgi:hypothetical protein
MARQQRQTVGLDADVRQPTGAATPDLRVLQEPPIEGPKYQDDADVHEQPFPESISKEKPIDTDDNGNEQHRVKRDNHALGH